MTLLITDEQFDELIDDATHAIVDLLHNLTNRYLPNMTIVDSTLMIAINEAISPVLRDALTPPEPEDKQ